MPREILRHKFVNHRPDLVSSNLVQVIVCESGEQILPQDSFISVRRRGLALDPNVVFHPGLLHTERWKVFLFRLWFMGTPPELPIHQEGDLAVQ